MRTFFFHVFEDSHIEFIILSVDWLSGLLFLLFSTISLHIFQQFFHLLYAHVISCDLLSYGHEWVCVQVYAWVCVGICRCVRVCAGVHGHAWLCTDVQRCAWVCPCVCRCALVCMGVHGYEQVCVGEFSEYLLETRFLTSADFNTYPIQIFVFKPTLSLKIPM